MRLWTLHPKYLDSRGLVALWREGLLAQKVRRGETKGYRNHPQLVRFRAVEGAIANYLQGVLREAVARGYNFDGSKILAPVFAGCLDGTQGQLLYEWEHLLRKLRHRDPARWESVKGLAAPDAHPLFQIIPGDVQDWEIRAQLPNSLS